MAATTNNGRRTYECVSCRERTTTDEFLGECPSCGGRVRNIAVPRQQ
ncbi:rubrerythrin-like domain-containing protein [Halobacterium rubrum]|nr:MULTISPECIES: rubrerythrin-like domain-containing protein [Halobacterium]MDH5021351.1 rubrerythrin-like domain-containing protein [Halobacterium rubrum]